MDSTLTVPKIALQDIIFAEDTRDDGEAVKNIDLATPRRPPGAQPVEKAVQAAAHRYMDLVDMRDRPPIILAYAKKLGNDSYARGLYEEAISYYRGAIETMSGRSEKLLATKFFNPTYLYAFNKFFKKEWLICVDFMACCNNIAQCYLKLNNLPSALDWLQELEVVWECYRITLLQLEGPDAFTNVLEHCTYRMKAAVRLINIYLSLGNTAAITHFSYTSSVLYPARFPEDIPQVKTLIEHCDAEKWFKPLHPIAGTASMWDVTEPDLQVRGIWTKLNMKSDVGPRRRKYDGCWIWRSRLYMFGGIFSKKLKRDLWYWDLTVERNWTRLPDVPDLWKQFIFTCQTPIVYNNVVYFFSGFTTLLTFNLISENWDIVKTRFNGIWPYSGQLYNTCISIDKSHMYVFGGHTFYGSHNLLMVLDLENFRWQLLGGQDDSDKQHTHWPSSRGAAACWIDPNKGQFCILYGITQVSVTQATNERNLCEAPEDLWSYSISDRSWTRERIRGNAPNPRLLMSTVYHQGLKSVIVYGGLGSTNAVSYFPQPSRNNDYYSYTEYGDAFIMDTSKSTWRQIVIRGFPTWRSEGHLLVDSATGNIYLTGGISEINMTATIDIPGTKTRCFGDLWRLEIELPGLPFDEKSFISRNLFWRAGLYRLCYACGNSGKNFFRCMGSCKGKYVFCSEVCQRSVWKEHKNVHGCKKIILNAKLNIN